MTASADIYQQSLLTVKGIADLAGVTSSAVSNWRRRHEDFPAAVRDPSRGELFERTAVVTWLRKRGIEVQNVEPSVSDHVWQALDSLRGRCRPPEAAVLLLQSVFLQSVLGTLALGGQRWQSRLQQIQDSGGELLPFWEQLLDNLAEEEFQLARALTLQEAVEEEALNVALREAARLLAGYSPGDIAGVLVDVWTETGGKAGAEAATSSSLADLLVGLLEPVEGVVYDPAFGVGRVLGEAWLRRESDKVQLLGQDVNEWAWRVGFLHLALQGADVITDTGDTLLDDRFRGLEADRIALVPPFKLSTPKSLSLSDPRWAYGVPKRDAEWLWVQHVVHHLKDTGVGALVVPRSALMGRRNGDIRAAVLESGVIDAVIGLPSGLLEDSGIPIYVLVISKERPGRRHQILFIDGSGLGSGGRGRRMDLPEESIETIVSTVRGWRGGDIAEKPRFSGVATIEEVIEADAELLPARFIRYLVPGATAHGTEVSQEFRSAEDRLKGFSGEPDGLVERILSSTTRASVREPTDSSFSYRLGDILSEAPERGRKQEEVMGGAAVPFVDVTDVVEARGAVGETSRKTAPPAGAAPTARRGDVLLVARHREGLGTESTCAVVALEGEIAFSEGLVRLRPDPDRVLPEYLRLVLSAPQTAQALTALGSGSVVASLRPELVEELQIPVPSLRIQRTFVEWWSDLQGATARLEELLGICAAIKGSLKDGLAGGVIELDDQGGSQSHSPGHE